MQHSSPRCWLTCVVVSGVVAASMMSLGSAGCASAGSGEEWSSKARSASSGGSPSTRATTTVAPTTEPTPAAPAARQPSNQPAPSVIANSAAPPIAFDPNAPVDAAALRAASLMTLEKASKSSWPQLRAHSIESLAAMPEFLDGPVSRGLIDENRGVRFVATLTIARAKRCDLVHLVEPLLRDSSASVRAAAIAALARCGKPVDQSPLAAMVTDDSTEVRANAFVAIGIIGNRSAVGLVRSALGKGMYLTDPVKVRVVELQAAECLVLLGETQEIEPIRAALFAPAEQGELTALACQMVGRLRDERSRPMLERILEASGNQARSPELRLAAADALGRLGGRDPSVLLTVITPYVSAPDAVVRAQAAAALGATGSAKALPALAALLSDQDEQVQVAAAGAILRLNGTT